MYQGQGTTVPGLGIIVTDDMVNESGPTSGINWTDVITHAIDTAGHVIQPTAYPQYPVYSPAGAAAVGVANSPGILILGVGLLAVVLLMAKKK